MKKILIILLIFANSGILLFSQGHVELKNRKDSVSYYVGVSMFDGTRMFGITLDDEMIIKGYRDAMNGEAGIEVAQANRYIQQVIRNVRQAEVEKTRTLGKEFLKENRKAEGIIETESGLQYRIIKQGDGEKPDENSIVNVNFKGYLLDGTVFDSSEKRGGTANFSLTQVVPGFSEALQLMPVGSIYVLYIPPELGFGDRGSGDYVKPGMTLMYEVELLDIRN